MHVVVSIRQERVAQRTEDTRLIAAEVIGQNQVQGRSRLRLVLIVPVRVVPAATAGHLFRGQAEQEEVILARFFGHFDSRAVTGTEGQCPVHHELHVTGATGFVAGSRDLIGNVGRGDQPLRQRHAVLGQEHDFEPTPHRRVPVDGASEIVKELNDELGEPVGGDRAPSLGMEPGRREPGGSDYDDEECEEPIPHGHSSPARLVTFLQCLGKDNFCISVDVVHRVKFRNHAEIVRSLPEIVLGIFPEIVGSFSGNDSSRSEYRSVAADKLRNGFNRL